MAEQADRPSSHEDADGEFLIGESKLSSVEEDAFGHEAHVDTLEKIIAEVPRPWHIALYGTWGSGKSSIVNLLYKRIRAKQATDEQYPDLVDVDAGGSQEFANTICVSFNAWKHAEDSLRTELLLDLNQSLRDEFDRRFGGQSSPDRPQETASSRLTLQERDRGILPTDELISELYDVEQESQTEIKSAREILSEVDSGLLAGAIGLLGLVLAYGVLEAFGSSFPLGDATVGLLQTVALGLITLGVGNAFFQIFMEEFRDARKDVDQKLANPQNEWSGAYENLFNAIIAEAEREYSDRHPEDAELERIVITIDDIDRCQSQTAYNILIAVKSFLAHEKCVYIVPCDEDALYDHLEAADEGEYLSDVVNQQNFLAKFFETELEVPTPSSDRLDEYFRQRQRQFDRHFDPRSLRVLQQANLGTPRRVTRALNRLVVLEELGRNRGVIELSDDESAAANIEAGSTAETGSTDRSAHGNGSETSLVGRDWSPERAFLAVVSILQTDYPRLHATLERDPEFLDEIYEELGGGFSADERQGLDPLLDSLHIPEERRDSLVAFLVETRDVARLIDAPGPYLRLSSDSEDIGDTFRSRFDRGRMQAARQLIENQMSEQKASGTESDEVLTEFIEYVIRKVSDETSQVDAFRTAVGVADAFDTRRRERIAEALLEALEEEQSQALLSEMELSQLEPILDALSSDRTQEFLSLYVQSIVGEDGLRPDNFASLLDGPKELFDNVEVQRTFAETLFDARRRDVLTDQEFETILADVREQKPALYTPELVRGK